MLTPFSPATGTAEAEPDCPSVQMIFARGTFEQPGVGATGQAFVDAVSDRLGGKSMDVYAANYPASLDFTHAAEGIIDDDVDCSIHNLTSIGKDGMQETDQLVLSIMANKQNKK